MRTIEIELDAFSGLPNPTWTLRTEQSEAAVGLFENLAESSSTQRLHDGLGYRGLRIRGLVEGTEMTIWNGIVQAEIHGRTLRWHDTRRELESYLLESAKSCLDDSQALKVIAKVISDIGDSAGSVDD